MRTIKTFLLLIVSVVILVANTSAQNNDAPAPLSLELNSTATS